VQAHAPSLRRSTKSFVPMSSIMQLMPSTSFAILEGRQSGFLTPLLLKKSAVLKLPTDPRTKQIFRPLDALNALKKTKKNADSASKLKKVYTGQNNSRTTSKKIR
jgi:hypothetical protein